MSIQLKFDIKKKGMRKKKIMILRQVRLIKIIIIL